MLESAAMGQNELKRYDMTGRVTLDLFMAIKNNVAIRLESYSLRAVSEKFLDADTKIDLPYAEMFEHYRSGDARRRALVAEYCAKDCDLPCLLIHKMGTVVDLVEMSKVTRTPMPALTTRGQQIKVYSQLIWEIEYACDMVLNRILIKPPSSYVGATVIVPKPGWYDEPIATLDFASLYPSIMRANRLCPSNLVIGDLALAEVRRAVAAGQIEIKEIEAGGRTHVFVRDDGIVPRPAREARRAAQGREEAHARGLRRLSSVAVQRHAAGAEGVDELYLWFFRGAKSVCSYAGPWRPAPPRWGGSTLR